MKQIATEILEDAKIAYKESIIIDNNILEERLLSIIGNAKLLLHELQKTKYTQITKDTDKNEVQSNAILKVKKRVPLWLTRSHQKNYKILATYMKLSENNSYPILLSSLEKNSGLNSKEFVSHYNQMKSFADKAHGKIFEETNGEIKLWEPVADFVAGLFKNNNIKNEEVIMDKKRAAKIVNSALGSMVLQPNNGGNMIFANQSSAKDVYWLNVHVNKVSDTLHFILNNKQKREFMHLIIPPYTLNKGLFVTREDKTIGVDKMDIEISLEPSTFLIDVKPRGTQFDFNQYLSGTYRY